MKRLPLTICILAHMVDQNLIQAVGSAQCADHVLLIENGIGKNAADWKQMPVDFRFQIISYPHPIVDFSQVRNWALAQAPTEWVLFLDSDEVIHLNSYDRIEKCIVSQTYSGMEIERSDIFYGKRLRHGEAGKQTLVRMGKKGSFYFTGAVHEVGQITGTIAPKKIEVMHYAHPSVAEFITSVSRYSRAVAAERKWSSYKILFDLCFFPPLKFIYGFILQAGWRDGWRGFVYAACMSLHSLLVRIYGYEKKQHTDQSI